MNLHYKPNWRAVTGAADTLGIPREVVALITTAYMDSLHGNPPAAYFPYAITSTEANDG